MIQKSKKIKLFFLKKILKKKKKIKINNSIIQNNSLHLKIREFYLIRNIKNKKIKKNCLFGISNKYIEKKSKFSRFAINKIISNNLNQNFNKFEK